MESFRLGTREKYCHSFILHKRPSDISQKVMFISRLAIFKVMDTPETNKSQHLEIVKRFLFMNAQ